MMTKYTVKDIEKALSFIKKHCDTDFLQIDKDELGRLIIKARDTDSNGVVITIFDGETAKFPEVTRTERLT